MARVLVFILVLMAIVGAAVAAGPTATRTWHDTKGNSFLGRAIALNGDNVVFEGADGSSPTVPLQSLRPQDRTFVEEHFRGASAENKGTENKVEESLPTALLVVMAIGWLVCAIGGIWSLVVAFRTSILWGLGCLFVPFVSLIFLILHWHDAKKPFGVELLGLAIIFGSMFLFPGSLQQLSTPLR